MGSRKKLNTASRIGNNLVNCIKPFTCLSNYTYVTMGAKDSEAPRWYLDQIVTAYQCGPGYKGT